MLNIHYVLENGVSGRTKDADYLQNLDKQAKVHDLGKRIDHMVCKFYDLTPEEIAIVEGKEQ